MNFKRKLEKIVKKNDSLLCIGLDTDLNKIPKHLLKEKDPIFIFNKGIIDNTFDLVCSYKPNIAFYEAYGENGHISLKKTIEYLQSRYSEIPIILDAKRADIANTAKMYARAAFEYWNVDAVTVYPYLGLDATVPFLEYKNKWTILIIKTSNPDSKVFQDLKVNKERIPFYLAMAKQIKKWNLQNVGLFIGATYPEELKSIRNLFPAALILTAGIGKQKAIIKMTVENGVDKDGNNLICNNSREVIYASNDKNFAQVSRKKALRLRDTINKHRI